MGDDEKSVPTIIKDLTKSFAIGQPNVAGHQELLKGIKQKLRDILNKLSKQGKARMKFDHGEKAAKKEEEEEEREKEKEEKMDKKNEKKEDKDKKDDKKEDKDKKELGGLVDPRLNSLPLLLEAALFPDSRN